MAAAIESTHAHARTHTRTHREIVDMGILDLVHTDDDFVYLFQAIHPTALPKTTGSLYCFIHQAIQDTLVSFKVILVGFKDV